MKRVGTIASSPELSFVPGRGPVRGILGQSHCGPSVPFVPSPEGLRANLRLLVEGTSAQVKAFSPPRKRLSRGIGLALVT